MSRRSDSKVLEIALVDDLEKCEKDVLDALAGLPDGAECRILINSGGGSVYAGLGIATTIEMKKIRATGVVLADCSSSALLVFASCAERLVAPHASFLFHPMQWSSEERSRLPGAVGWAREFKRIEKVCCEWICSRLGIPEQRMRQWVHREIYITAEQMVEYGMARFLPGLETGVDGRRKPHPAARPRAKVVSATESRRARVVPAAARARRPRR